MQTVDDLLLPAPPHVIGPVWRKTLDGDWYLPKHTLGWGVVEWLYDNVKSPGGDTAGEPFEPTMEQLRFLLWWYAVDEHGKNVYRNGVLRRCKGWGKDPLAAAMALAEVGGPVKFDRFEDGEPVGKRRPAAWVQIAATSQEQSRNTMLLFPIMITAKLKKELHLDVNKTIISTDDGCLIQAVTASPAGLEGNRPSLVIESEGQWWTESNQGHELHGVLEGNATKVKGRVLSILNAHIPGQNSVGEQLWDTYVLVATGQAVNTGDLYDALEAPVDTPVSEIPSQSLDPEGYEAGIEKLREGLLVARGDSYWLDPDAMLASILSPTNPVTESRRKYLNQINAAEDSWLSPAEWDSCRDPELVLHPGDKIALGFDGSKSNDHTGLVACRIEDGAIFLLNHWNPENNPHKEVPRDQVDAAVRGVFERYRVLAFRADVKEFETYVDSWAKDFRSRLKVNASPNNPVAFDMRGQQKPFSFDVERFHNAVLEGELVHDGNGILRQHVLNAHRNPTTFGTVSIAKETRSSKRKIDVAVCAVLAFGARHSLLMSKKSGTGGVVMVR